MNKKIILFTILVVSLSFIGCGIQPPKEDLEKAKIALAKAEEVEAQKYAPTEYNDAKSKLEQGEKTMVPKKSRKNKEAKETIGSAEQKANEAFQKSAPKFAEDNLTNAKQLLENAKNMKVNVSLKEEYSKAEQILKEAEELYAKNDFYNAGKKAKEVQPIIENAIKLTDEKRIKAESSLNEARQKFDQIQK